MRKLQITLCTALLCALACGKPDGQQTIEAPAVPQNVKFHSATETSLTFQWGAVEGATAYGWKLTQDGTQVKSGTVKQRNVTVEGLSKGTAYGFAVNATGEGGTSAWSAEVEAKTEGVATPPGGPRVCVDAPLVLELDSVPTLGTEGQIKIFKADGTEVDRINLADIGTVIVRDDGITVPAQQLVNPTASSTFMDTLPCSGKTRVVHCTPVKVAGKTLVIQPHSAALDFDTQYYVTVDQNVCGKAVAKGEWEFTTTQAPSKETIRVAADGSGDFCTLQRALSHCADGATISLANGTYAGLLYLRDKKNITVKGDSRDKAVIAYPNAESYMSGSSARCLWLVENCDNLVLENLTIHNTYGQHGQAECIYFNSGNNTHKLTIENCSLLSLQDTFLTKGEVWVHNSLIAGTVDFIWGYPKACLFEDCEIRCEYYKNGGYIIQSRVPQESAKGFVFLNCKITTGEGAKDGSVYLARSAGQADCFDNVTYVNCQMASVIAPAGWYTSPAPNPSAPTATSGWREYGSKAPDGTAITGHNAYGKVLTAAEAEPYSSKTAVLGW